MNDILERAARLSSPDAAPQSILEEIMDIRERVEVMHGTQYSTFLEHLFPVFERLLLERIPPSFRSDDINHRIRCKVLEILNRLPTTEPLRSYARRVFQVALTVIRKDNEDNALTALRVIFELERNYQTTLENDGPRFLELVHNLYSSLEQGVMEMFTEVSLEEGADRLSPSENDGAYTIIPGMNSFKVIVECPLIVMLLFQLHSPLVPTNVPTLIPLMLKGLTVRVPASVTDLKLSARGNRVKQFRFEGLLSCQVKTLSFLTFLLLQHGEQMTSHEAEIACNVITLMRVVPAESISVRRELLVATRHILSTPSHRGFFPYLNALLDENVLLGTPQGRFDLAVKPFPSPLPAYNSPQTVPLNQNAGGVQPRTTARKQTLVHLAYAALADLVQHMRGSMDIAQLSRVVYLFTRNIHDHLLPLSMQATSVRLLLNLVDGIYHHRESGPQAAQPGREFGAHGLLVKILDALARKLGTLRYLIPRIAAHDKAATAGLKSPTQDAVAIPMDHYMLVRSTPGSQGSSAGGEASAPDSLERSSSTASQEGGEVVKIDVFPNGHLSARRKRPLVNRPEPLDHRELERALVLGIAVQNHEVNSTMHHDTSTATPDSMKDVCVLIRTIVMGMKTIFYCITNMESNTAGLTRTMSSASATGQRPPGASPIPPSPQQNVMHANSGPKAIPEEELRLVSKVFSWTLQCLPAFRFHAATESTNADIDAEENEMLDTFASAFTVLEPSTFTDIMQANMEFFYGCMVRNKRVVRVAMNFLRSSSASRSFASVLLPFLLSRFSLITGRHCAVPSSLEQYVDGLMEGKLGEATDGNVALSWTYLCCPPSMTVPAKPYEATAFGGSFPTPVETSRIPQSTPDAAGKFEGVGVPSPDQWPAPTRDVRFDEFPKDEEAYVLYKLHRATFQSIVTLSRQPAAQSIPPAVLGGLPAPPPPHQQQTGIASSLASLLSTYLEPSVIVCLAQVAESMTFPLERLRKNAPPLTGKPDVDENVDNAIICMRACLSAAIEAPHDVRDALSALVNKLAKLITRAINKLLVVALSGPQEPSMLGRADHLAELCVALSFSLVDDANPLALPFSHALAAGSRGNESLVGKALTALERLVPSGGFERVAIARGGLVARALKGLYKSTNHNHGIQAMKLFGKCTYEITSQLYFVEPLDDLKSGKPVAIPISWMEGSSAESMIDLTKSAIAVCKHLEDSFLPLSRHSADPVDSPLAQTASVDQELAEVFHKKESLAFIVSLCVKIGQRGSTGLKDHPFLLDALFTGAADKHLVHLAKHSLADLIVRDPAAVGEALARCFGKGCPNRCFVGKEMIQNISLTAATDVREAVLVRAALPKLLDQVKQKSSISRTGSLFGLCVVLETDYGRQTAIAFERDLLSAIVLAFEDYVTEFGSDGLYHAGNLLELVLKSLKDQISTNGVDIMVASLFRLREARARRILRGGIHYLVNKIGYSVEHLATSIQTVLEKVRANPPFKTEMTTLALLAARAEFFLFAHETLGESAPELVAMNSTMAIEFLQEFFIKHKKFLNEETDNQISDPDTYPYTFFPRSALLKAALLRLARRVYVPRIEQAQKSQQDDLLVFAFAAIFSIWPFQSRSAELLLGALSHVESLHPALKHTGQELVNRLVQDPQRGIAVTVNHVRAVDRVMSALNKRVGVLSDTFGQDVLTIFQERTDPVKVLSSITKKANQGEELHVTAAFIDLICHVPVSTVPVYLEQLIANVAKLESSLHLFHFSHFFPTIMQMAQAAGRQMNMSLKIVLGTNCGGKLSSPFRAPLARFLNLAPGHCLQHAFTNDRLIKRTYSSLLCDLLRRRTEGAVLREELLDNPNALKALMEATFEVAYEPPPGSSTSPDPSKPGISHEHQLRRAQARVVELRFQGVRLIRSVVKWTPEILARHPNLLNSVIAVMKAPDREAKMAAEEKLPLRHRTLSRIACKSVIAGFRAGASASALSEILPVSLIRSTSDTSFLVDFFSRTLTKLKGSKRNEIITTFTSFLADSRTPLVQKETALRLVLIPVLAHFYLQKTVFSYLQKSGQTLEQVFPGLGMDVSEVPAPLPSDAIKSLISMVVVDPSISQESLPSEYGPASVGEDYQVQLLQLSTLLMAHQGKDLMEHRKALIKCAWSHLNAEDNPAKSWAYVNICTFIDVYHTPSEIILQIYVELLRAHSMEARELVSRALDLLAPALPKRMETPKYIKAIKWTKKLLFDDGHHLPQLTHVWQMVTQHPSLFYHYRAQFVPQMVNSLNRIGLPHNCPIENRELAVNLAELVLTWERTRELEEAKLPTSTSDASAMPPPSSFKEGGYRINPTMFSIIANFLMRIALQLADTRDARSKALSKRCVVLFKASLDLAKRRCTHRVPIAFTNVSKAVHTYNKKLHQLAEQDIAAVKKHLTDTSAGVTDGRNLPPPAWDRRTDPGVMSCALEILIHITAADDLLITMPFLNECAGDLHVIIEPALTSPERNVMTRFARLISNLLTRHSLTSKTSPLNEPPALGLRRESSQETSPQIRLHSTAPPGKSFYPALQHALHKRLHMAAEKLEASVLASVSGQQQPAGGSGAGFPGMARGAMGGGAPQQQMKHASGSSSLPHNIPPPPSERSVPKVVQQRIAKEIATRQAEHFGAGPKGTLMILKVLQILFGSEDPVPFPDEPSIVPSLLGTPAVAEKFAGVLIRVSTKIARDLVHSGASSSARSMASGNKLDFMDDATSLQRNKHILSQIVDISLSVLGQLTLAADVRRNFMQMVATLVDKLDASDHLVLRRIVKIIGSWFFTKSQGQRERNAFWIKLAQLEARLAGHPDTFELMQDLHSLALHCPAPHPRSALVGGLMSPSPDQRNTFWAMNFPTHAHTPDLMRQFFTSRKDDLNHLSHKFWLPLAVRFLLESRVLADPEMGDADLPAVLRHLCQAAFADGSGEVAYSAWNDALRSVWQVSGDDLKRTLVESLSGFLLQATSNLAVGKLAVRASFEQRRMIHLSALQPIGLHRQAAEVRRIEHGFMMCRHPVINKLFESLAALPGLTNDFIRPEILRHIGNSVVDDKFSTVLALEGLFTSSPVRAAESMALQYSELAEDEMARGSLRVALAGSRHQLEFEKAFDLEIGTRWREAMQMYTACALENGWRSHSGHGKTINNKGKGETILTSLDQVSSVRDFKRARMSLTQLMEVHEENGGDDTMDTGEEDDVDDDDEMDGPWTSLEVRAWDMRLKKCAGLLGDWQSVMEWGLQESEPRTVIEALSRRVDLLKGTHLLNDLRPLLPPGFPFPNANVDFSMLEVCSAIRDTSKSPQDLEELLRKAYKTALYALGQPSKGVCQRLAELEESITHHVRSGRMTLEMRQQSLYNLVTTWTNRAPTASVSQEDWTAITSWRMEFITMCGGLGITQEMDESILLLLLQSARQARSKGANEFANVYLDQLRKLSKFPRNMVVQEMVNERARIVNSVPNGEVPSAVLSTCYRELCEAAKLTEKKDTVSELHRMRARVLNMAGKSLETVEEALRDALQVEPNNGRVWLDWGRYLSNRDKGEAAACVGKSMSLGHNGARLLVPLLLDPDGGAVSQVESINSAWFIQWIPTFLATPCPFSKTVLERLVQSDPQTMLHELQAIKPQQLSGTSKHCLELIRKNHAEVYHEFIQLQTLLSRCDQVSPGEHEWRPRVLRIPGTRRLLDRLFFAGRVCGRQSLKHRVDFLGDDGRSSVRFAVHDGSTVISEEKRRAFTLVWLLYEILVQEGGLAESFVWPSFYHITDSILLEKDTECTSLKCIVQSQLKWTDSVKPPPHVLRNAPDALKRWFFAQYDDVETLFQSRRRFTKQLGVHSFATTLCHGPLTGGPSEILIGRGVESVLVGMGIDGRGEPEESAPHANIKFRLTPHLQELVTTQGVWGLFANSFSGAARAITKRDPRHAIIVFLGEDAVSKIEVLSEDTEKRDAKVTELIQAATEFSIDSAYQGEWMPWM